MANNNITIAISINGKRARIQLSKNEGQLMAVITGLIRRWVHPSISWAKIYDNGNIAVCVGDTIMYPNIIGWAKVIAEATGYKRKVFTYIKDGYIISSTALKGHTRTYRLGCSVNDACLCHEEVFRKEKITSPHKKWDGEPFTNYSATCGENPYVEGVLSYEEYCNEVNKNNKFLFNDFTKCSEAMWDVLTRH